MNRTTRRRLDRMERTNPPPSKIDTSDMTAQEIVMHDIRHHGLEALMAGLPPLIMVPRETHEDVCVLAPSASECPASPVAAPPPTPATPAAWHEEYVQWRLRGPEDYDWGDDNEVSDDDEDEWL